MTTTINRREFLELAALAGAGIAGVLFRWISFSGRALFTGPTAAI